MFSEYFQQIIDNAIDIIETDYVDQDWVNIRDIIDIDDYVEYSKMREDAQVKFLDEITYRTGVIVLDQ